MATSAQRRLNPKEVRRFGSLRSPHSIPDLTEIQTRSYEAFLQYDVPADKRKDQGIEGVLREIFPIESYDKTLRLEYIRYELGKPRYEPDECRQLRLTYGRPFRVWLRLNKEQPIEEEVYLGDMPIMLGGGEFIINGAERVVVSQLHRSPGVDFVSELEAGDRRLHSCRIIPERGSWIELNISKKDTLSVRIDQSGKFSAMTLLRAMDPEVQPERRPDPRVLRDRRSRRSSTAAASARSKARSRSTTSSIRPSSDRAGEDHPRRRAEDHQERRRDHLHLGAALDRSDDRSQGSADLQQPGRRHHQQPRRGPAANLSAAASGQSAAVGKGPRPVPREVLRHQPLSAGQGRPLPHQSQAEAERARNGNDAAARRPDRGDQVPAAAAPTAIRTCEIDDIDHLGNRRLRTIDELACDELRKGFLKLRRTVQERMSLKDVEDMTPRSLINPKSISAAIEYFFGRGELSQVVDQTNPLSMLTHERRLSALGPGGLNRKRAGFEVRDVHISHYGRICPIETPEGTNIGLISSLAIYSAVDEYGFLVTPYRKVTNGKLTDEVVWLRADEESEAYLAPADAPVENGKLAGRHDHRPLPRRLRDGADRQGAIHRRGAEPDGGRLGRFDSVPGARRRQPRVDGLQHAAASRAAAGHRAADRGHRHGARRGA